MLQGNRTTPSYVAFTDTGALSQPSCNTAARTAAQGKAAGICKCLRSAGAMQLCDRTHATRLQPVTRLPTHAMLAERLIGDAAKNQVAMNPINTVFDAKRLIGRKFQDATVQSDIKLWPFTVRPGAGDVPEIVVQYKGESKVGSGHP